MEKSQQCMGERFQTKYLAALRFLLCSLHRASSRSYHYVREKPAIDDRRVEGQRLWVVHQDEGWYQHKFPNLS
jgi:hypothetical protein